MSVIALDYLKNYLDITYDDSAVDDKLNGILSRANSMLNNYIGQTIDYLEDTLEGQLLLDLCRYIYNNCVENFTTNYQSDLLTFQIKYEVAEYAEISDV